MTYSDLIIFMLFACLCTGGFCAVLLWDNFVALRNKLEELEKRVDEVCK